MGIEGRPWTPGKVDDNYCDMTNLSWVIDGPGLQSSHGINSVKVINDFAAVGYGVLDLQDDEVVTLNGPPKDPTGPVAVLGPGTGGGSVNRPPYPSTTSVHYIRRSTISVDPLYLYHPSGGSPHRSWAARPALPSRDNCFTPLTPQMYRLWAQCATDRAQL